METTDCSTLEDSLSHFLRHTVDRVDGFQAVVPQQTQARDAEASMPDIDHVTRSIRDAAICLVLRFEDEGDQSIAVDPVLALDDGQATQYPPTVAYIFFFLGSAVKTTSRKLPFAQPLAESVFV